MPRLVSAMANDCYIYKHGEVRMVRDGDECMTDPQAMELADRLIAAHKAGFKYGCTCCGAGLSVDADGQVATCSHCDEGCWPNVETS